MTSLGPDDRPLTDVDYQRLLAFRSELRDFLRWSEQAAHDAGLTPSLHQLLLVVRGSPTSGPAVGEVAEALHMRHHSAVELAQRAETAGLLSRERDPADRRRVRLRLTDRGRRQLDRLSRDHLTRIPALASTLERVLFADAEADTDADADRIRLGDGSP